MQAQGHGRRKAKWERRKGGRRARRKKERR